MTYRRSSLLALLFRCAALAAASSLAATVVSAAEPHHHHDESAIGQSGDDAKADRDIRIEMKDSMRFIPNRIKVRKGETVRFVVTNEGPVDHEFVLGSAAMLRHHAEEMKKNPQMQHESAHHLTIAPGKSGELVWQFTRPGTVEFACLVPGHFEAGMRGTVTVK